MFIIAILYGIGTLALNASYLETIQQEQIEGATWHYVGPTDKEDNAQQLLGADTIYWKLKKPSSDDGEAAKWAK